MTRKQVLRLFIQYVDSQVAEQLFISSSLLLVSCRVWDKT
jgi:hypothetical protein